MKPFSIDPAIVDSYISAGEIATAAERHFAEEIDNAREDLRHLEREMARKRQTNATENPGDLAQLPILRDKLARLQAQAAEGHAQRADEIYIASLARRAVATAGMVL